MSKELLIPLSGIIGVILGALITFISQLITANINLKNEKKKILFQMEVNKLSELEKKIGILSEVATSYSQFLKDEEFRVKIAELTYVSGQYKRYKTLNQLIRDIQNRISILLEQEKNKENPTETRKEVGFAKFGKKLPPNPVLGCH